MTRVLVNSNGKAFTTSNNRVLSSSGITPSGSISITENDTYDVTNYASAVVNVSGGGSSPVIESLNVTPSTSAQTITAESGVDGYSPVNVSAVTSSIDANIQAGNIKDGVTILGVTGNYTGSGGVGIPREVSAQGVYQMPSNSFTFSLPSNVTDIGARALFYAFRSCSTVLGADLSSLTILSGQEGLGSTFTGCGNFRNINLSNLTTISGYYACSFAFSECPLTVVSFPALSTISGSYALSNILYNCQSLTSVSFPALSTISGEAAFSQAFRQSSLTNISFPALSTISTASAFPYAFSLSSITSISFPALSTISDNRAFSQMLDRCSNVTVHFPFDLKSVISSWYDVTSGFDGTNTTVLFDLNACELTFDITPNSGNRITVNGNELSSNTTLVSKGSTASYQIYNSSYGLYISEYGAPDASTATVTADITVPTYNTISLNISESGLTVTVTIDGTTYTLTETGNTGVYTINLYKTLSDSVTVNYLVNGGDNYRDASGTLTFNNSDISETITLQPAQDVAFTRPNLTSNGTMGGSSFAVDMPDAPSYSAYRAVDSDNYSSVDIEEVNGFCTFDFYNPKGLKISKLLIRFESEDEVADEIIIEGSNDGSTWSQINTWSGAAFKIKSFTVNSSSYYKYHRLKMIPSNGHMVLLSDLEITAVYKG